MTKIMYSKTLPELKIINKLPKNSKEKIVSRNYIEYKTLTNQNSPKYTIPKPKCLLSNYQNRDNK